MDYLYTVFVEESRDSFKVRARTDKERIIFPGDKRAIAAMNDINRVSEVQKGLGYLKGLPVMGVGVRYGFSGFQQKGFNNIRKEARCPVNGHELSTPPVPFHGDPG